MTDAFICFVCDEDGDIIERRECESWADVMRLLAAHKAVGEFTLFTPWGDRIVWDKPGTRVKDLAPLDREGRRVG